MARIPLVGPTYQSRSVAADSQRTRNWYVEHVESGRGKAPVVLYPTPGLKVEVALPQAPVRALLAQEPPEFYAIGGSSFFQLDAQHGTTLSNPVARGLVENDGRPATLSGNGRQGHQVFIVSGGKGYCYDTETTAFTPLTMLVEPVLMGTFIEGYFVAINPTGFQISAPYNGLVWDGADVAIRSQGSDPVVAGMQTHRELWLFGERTSEVWYNTGQATNTFAPIPGVFIEMGCGATFSAVPFDQTLAWLGRNDDGDHLILQAVQYNPRRLSTHALEAAWARYARVDDATAWTYQDEGHSFYVLTFPTAGATWVYDQATQLWHERSFWNVPLGLDEPHRGLCHAFLSGRHLVGDRENGNIYQQAVWFYDDAGTPIRRVRRLPHLSQENRRARFTRLEVEMETGLGLATGQGADPQLMLRWSDDRGHTWGPEWWRHAGRQGHYGARVAWERLGTARDRVFEVSVSDPTPWRLVDGYLTTEEGRS